MKRQPRQLPEGRILHCPTKGCPNLLMAWGATDGRLLAVCTACKFSIERPTDGQPMNPSGEAVDDASAPYGLAQTTTPSGAGPMKGRPQGGSSDHPAPAASGNGAGSPTGGT